MGPIDKTPLSTMTLKMTEHTMTSRHRKFIALLKRSQAKNTKSLSDNELHPDLMCDIEYPAVEYQWPELPKFVPDVQFEPQRGLFDELEDDK